MSTAAHVPALTASVTEAPPWSPTVDVVTEIVIHRPVEIVASFAADPDNVPRWYQNISTVAWQTEPPLTLGSRVAFVARFLGRTLAYTYEVIDYQPGERLVMQTAEGPFPMRTTYTWERTAKGHTRMQLRNSGTPAGFSRLLRPLMVPAMRRANRKDLQLLAAVLEHDPPRD